MKYIENAWDEEIFANLYPSQPKLFFIKITSTGCQQEGWIAFSVLWLMYHPHTLENVYCPWYCILDTYVKTVYWPLDIWLKDLDRYGCLTIRWQLDVASVHLGCVVHKGEITWFQDNCPAVLFNKISLFTSYDIYYVRQQYIKSIARYQHRHSDWHWHYTWFDIDLNISFHWEYM